MNDGCGRQTTVTATPIGITTTVAETATPAAAAATDRTYNNLTVTTKMPADENAGRAFVYNSEAPTILINNYTRTTNGSAHNKMDVNGLGSGGVVGDGNNVKKSSITIYTNNSDSDGQIKIMINLDRPANQAEFDAGGDKQLEAVTTARTTTGNAAVSVAMTRTTATTNNVDTMPPTTLCSLTKIKKEKLDIDDMDVMMKNVDSHSIDAAEAYRSNPYAIGDDVFVVDNADNRFYLGTIKTMTFSKCMVRFDDGTERWALFDELHKLDVPKWQLPTCVTCKSNTNPKAVRMCDRCCRGYHRDCCAGNEYADGRWYCTRLVRIFSGYLCCC